MDSSRRDPVRRECAQIYVIFLSGLLHVSTFCDDVFDQGWIFAYKACSNHLY